MKSIKELREEMITIIEEERLAAPILVQRFRESNAYKDSLLFFTAPNRCIRLKGCEDIFTISLISICEHLNEEKIYLETKDYKMAYTYFLKEARKCKDIIVSDYYGRITYITPDQQLLKILDVEIE